ncbi:uncharacterized protein PHACADRAFT_83686 [Phanerochaete carnosa HHB-10118-sp]|uniref:Uncharacterized protein n=1 Tax=Phanerochaete carnosa (strain HHB-10118-sp) TaxID=650164 RepID=K5WB00_PHACS|nr:uncharacterized protein PHACADRAFT_83686 [Phanerochaete carnosa HHB-10118-sp]EKM61133.1 hypothetical protein PHACADRAFT_83686 [Phanerochaete carnosa HHB-10118-sp]
MTGCVGKTRPPSHGPKPLWHPRGLRITGPALAAPASNTMSTSPAPSVARGEILLQPSYFTSSLFVDPVREDIAQLVQIFAQAFLQPAQQDDQQAAEGPFAFFKAIWKDSGWTWFHFKVLDGRARETFIRIVLRCFSEYFVESVNPLAQTIALFGMYTFFMMQPSTSAPSLYTLKHIPLPLDVYKTLLELPSNLSTPQLLPLQPYATHLLETLLTAQAFHILPSSSLRAQNPSDIPRERFVEDGTEAPTGSAVKKKGRPSRRDKARKAKDAAAALDRWLDKNTVGGSSTSTPSKTTHTLISHPPAASRAIYTMEKTQLLNVIDTPGDNLPTREALIRANDAVLTRLRKIDEMAAERGLEVGGEGGEKTGLARVDRAVKELKGGHAGSRGGILNLLEGAGLEGQRVGDADE